MRPSMRPTIEQSRPPFGSDGIRWRWNCSRRLELFWCLATFFLWTIRHPGKTGRIHRLAPPKFRTLRVRPNRLRQPKSAARKGRSRRATATGSSVAAAPIFEPPSAGRLTRTAHARPRSAKPDAPTNGMAAASATASQTVSVLPGNRCKGAPNPQSGPSSLKSGSWLPNTIRSGSTRYS